MRKIIALAILSFVSAIPASATTKLYCKSQTSAASGLLADNYASLTQSVLPFVSSTTNTTASGTLIQVTKTAGGAALACVSPPILSNGTTLTTANGFTANFWASESNALANAGMRVIVTIIRTGCTVIDTSKGTELTGSMAAQNWTATESACPYVIGDRLLITPYITNVGTMGAGQTVTMDYAGKTSSADGDSFVTLADTISFYKEPEFIQDCADAGGTSPQLCVFPGVGAAGNVVLVIGSWGCQSCTASVSDTVNSYTSLSGPTNWNGTSNREQFFHADNITGGTTLTATVAVTGSPTYVAAIAAEWAGVSASPVDVTVGAIGSGTTADTGSVLTNYPNETIIGLIDADAGTVSAGSGYVLRGGFDAFEEKNVMAIVNADATETVNSGAWIAQLVGLKWGTQPTFTMPPSIRGEECFCEGNPEW